MLLGFSRLGAIHVRYRTALLRAVLDEVSESISHREIGARTHVASKILEAASKGQISPEALRRSPRTLARADHVALTGQGPR